jgi:hypothetical protein
MKEDFLHYVWKYKLFVLKDLYTTSNENIEILKSGTHNCNSGPDFLNAALKIDGQYWFGNVEIHIKSSDWYAHNHENDSNYDAVILHVVWEDDVVVYAKNNQPLPTLVLKDRVDKGLLASYLQLLNSKSKWIACENEIAKVNSFEFENWKERLYFERLERKANEIKTILVHNNSDFEATLFVLLCRNFGLKVNAEAFFQLANSFDFSILKKVRTNQLQLAALLFGQAGFLEDKIEDVYYNSLKIEYNFLQKKFHLQPITKHYFSFFRMRPSGFPTIRIAQLIALYHANEHLFLQLMELKHKENYYQIFEVQVNKFWENHFTFDKISKKITSKKISKSFVGLLLINTIIPLKFLYQKNRGVIVEDEFLELLKVIKPEKNNIIEKFSSLSVTSINAFDSQALLQLKNEYCDSKRCLHCAVGKIVLKS